MNYELRIQAYNGEWLIADVGPNEVIAMTYQANDIAELKHRQANRSNKIKLPHTANNNIIFGFSGEIRSAYDHAYGRIPCTLAIDGIQISGAGSYLLVTAATSTHYECTIFGGIFDFFTAIKEARLRDLRGIKDVYAWDEAKIEVDYIQNKADVLYPIMDWNMEELVPSKLIFEGNPDKQQAPGIDVKTLYPCVRLKRLLECICEAWEYTLETDLEDDDRYLNAAIPCVSHYFDLESKGKGSYRQTELELVELCFQYVGSNGKPYNFMDSGTVNISSFQLQLDQLTYKTEMKGQHTFEMKFDSQGSDLRQVRLKVTKGGVVVFNATTTDRFDRKLKIRLNKDEILSFALTSDSPEGAPCNVANLSIACTNIVQDLDKTDEIKGGDMFPIVRNLPDISQLDLFKLFLQMFGLMVQVDNRTRVVRCYSFARVYANRKSDTVRDWSGKLDGRSIEMDFQLDYARRNYLRYKEYESTSMQGEQEVEVKTESVGYFDVNDWTLKQEQDLFELGAVACDEAPHFDLGHTAKIRLRRNGEAVKNGPFTVLYLRKIKLELGKPSFRLVRGEVKEKNGKQVSELVLAEFWPFDAQELLKRYYHELSSRLSHRSRLLTVDMLLSPIDVADFDHSIPVYLRQYNAYFYVNKISNYRSDKLTKVELVRL